jgi:hypothetical protein
MKFVRALSLCLFVPALASAVVWNNQITNEQTLAFGNDPRLRGVGWLVGRGTGSFLGVSRDGIAWGISAKHVVDTNDTARFRVGDDGEFDIANAVGYAGSDISVFQILGWNLSLANKKLHTSGNYTAGTRFISAGYGNHGPENWTSQSFDARRRGFETVLDSFEPNDPSLWFEDQPFLIDRFDAPGDPNFRTLEGFGAPGDSGSFLLDEQDQIWGVLTDGQPERYGNRNWYATITPALAQQIYATTNIDPVPEPSSLLALAAGLWCCARRRG